VPERIQNGKDSRPKNFLALAEGSRGDVNPFILIGRELRERGHHYTLLANEYFESTARDAGLDFIATAPTSHYQIMARDASFWSPDLNLARLSEALDLPNIEKNFELLRQNFTEGRTAVLGSSLFVSCHIFCEIHNTPLVTISVAPSTFHGADIPFVKMTESLVDKNSFNSKNTRSENTTHILDRINSFREKQGLNTAIKDFDKYRFSIGKNFCAFPNWLSNPTNNLPSNIYTFDFLFEDGRYLEDVCVPRAWDSKRPIMFTFGSANGASLPDTSLLAEACERTSSRGVLISVFSTESQARSPWITHLPSIPFGKALSKCKAIVHHGGIGTCARAIQSQVPQVVLPGAFDQFSNAKIMKHLGVGDFLRREKLTATVLAEKIIAVTNDISIKKHLKKYSQCIGNRKKIKNMIDEISIII